MDKESYSWGGIGFLALFFLIVVAFMFNRNGCGGWNNGWGNGCAGWGFNGFGVGVGVPGYGLGFEDYKAICASEKQEIINSARTQYLIEQQSAATQAVVNATANATQTKIDFYAYQDLRDRLAEEQRKVLTLENQLYNDRKFGEIDKQLAAISCQMLRRPDVTGIGAVCPNAAIINGLGINSLNSCGCNGLA